MTKFSEALHEATAILYKVTWIPEDWPDPNRLCTSYVVALSMEEATLRLSPNPFDIKHVVMCGHVIERRGIKP